MNPARQAHLDEFYRLLDQLASSEDGPCRRADCTGSDGWPRHGVYFFLEDGETNADGTSKVVRVGTHALRPTDQITLWGRLRQHRGRTGGRNPGGGNHRTDPTQLLGPSHRDGTSCPCRSTRSAPRSKGFAALVAANPSFWLRTADASLAL